MNIAFSKMLEKIEKMPNGTPLPEDLASEQYLYYVACSRARHLVHNAKYLDSTYY